MTSRIGLFVCALFFIALFLMAAYSAVIEPTVQAFGG